MTAAQTPSTLPTLRLTGLKAHHPLGFLAACGTLRCVTLQGWCDARLSWSVVESSEGGEHLAVLHSSRLGTESIDAADKLIAALAAQAKDEAAQQSECLTWLNWADKIDGLDNFREAALRPSDRKIGIGSAVNIRPFATLATDASDPKDLHATLFDLTSGNQRLLSTLRDLATGLALADTLPASPTKKQRDANRAARDAFHEAIIGPWLYRDDAHSLGWDPSTQRLHALRNKVPEQDKANRSVRAAVFLASQALSLFPVFCSQGRTRTTGFARGRTGRTADATERDDWFTWPVWDRPISIDTLRALLAQQFSARLASRGVVAVYRSRRAKTGGSQGDYRVLTQPQLHKLQ